jgi:succinylglutamate desuccinylase
VGGVAEAAVTISESTANLPRCLGVVRGRHKGPTVVLTGGLHGNEPAGVFASRDVLQELEGLYHRLRGTVVAFTGNRAGLERGTRFVTRDLNRSWYGEELEQLHRTPLGELRAEDLEQRELYDAFIALEQEDSELVFIDLHTTSGPTEPFVCVSATPGSARLASALPVAEVVGLERELDATMLSWCSSRGHLALSFEAGRHADVRTRQRHVAAVFRLLVAASLLDANDIPSRWASILPDRPYRRVVEVRHRHVVEAGDEFEMVGCFDSFDPIEAGQIVARDRRGFVRAPESGLMLMPRYQPQGEDGFFVVRDVAADACRR